MLKTTYTKIGVGRFCMLFGKTRHAFYDKAWRKELRLEQEVLVLELVRARRERQPKVGTEKLHLMIASDLNILNIKMGRDALHGLLQTNRLTVKQRKRRPTVTTDSNHPFYKYPNRIKGLHLMEAEMLWVCDITYLQLVADRYCYLSLVTDGYSKKIVGYNLHPNLKAEGSLLALRMALAGRTKTTTTLIHHSDRGVQYCCEEYTSLLTQSGIIISMAEKGNPYENAVAERINQTLKCQLGLSALFPTYQDAVHATHLAVKVYNEERLHMSCGNLTPLEAHNMKGELEKKWKAKVYHKQTRDDGETI